MDIKRKITTFSFTENFLYELKAEAAKHHMSMTEFVIECVQFKKEMEKEGFIERI